MFQWRYNALLYRTIIRRWRKNELFSHLNSRYAVSHRYQHTSTASTKIGSDYNSSHEYIYVLDLSKLHVSITTMLYIEEILMRASKHNWIVYNTVPHSTNGIVMGIGGDASTLVNIDNCVSDNIPVYKRFTGGGTVYIDENVRFVSLIVNESALPNLKLWPRHIMSYTQQLYNNVFTNTGTTQFILRDNDYCFGNLKFAGNAQSITSRRWLHHTSFLYDYNIDAIEKYLLLPAKQPEYRQRRPHSDFICRMKDYINTDLYDIPSFQHKITQSAAQWFKATDQPIDMPLSDNTAQISNQLVDELNITDEMINVVPLLAEVKRLQQYGKYTIGTKQVQLAR